MTHLRELLLTVLLVLPLALIQAQIIGGRDNGVSTPKEVEASKVTAGGFSGDVSLFSGTYNSSYALGTVSTPDGLSFSATISYSSSYSTGSNQPHSSGIPYGEGWNLDLPSISITTEDYNKYTRADLHAMNVSNQNHGPGPFTKEFTTTEMHKEGELHWLAPKLSIPGIASGRMVFKGYKNGDNPVFVLHKFDRYVEAVFMGDTWEVQLDDGTVYYFSITKANYRNAPNQRVDIAGASDPSAVSDVIIPKSEILSWYITEIYHPNKQGRIFFKYKGFGAFDYFKEYKQPQIRQAFEAYNTIFIDNQNPAYDPTLIVSPVGTPALLRVTYKDLFLEEVSTGYEKLVFKHESIPTHGGTDLLNLWDTDVSRKDSLYSFKTVYSWGVNGTHGFNATQGSDFSPWKRYHHMRSEYFDGSNLTGYAEAGSDALPSMPIATNPYVGSRLNANSSNYHLVQEKVDEASYVPFEHGYLESPRIGSNLPAGDIYEIKTSIYNGNTSNPQDGFINFDINISSGHYDHFDPNSKIGIGTSQVMHPRAKYYNMSNQENIFSTFNQAIKWNSLGSNSTELETSNFFTLSNLPNQYRGFNIQIGPGNSDNRMNASPVHTYNYDWWTSSSITLLPGQMPDPGYTYYGRDAATEDYFDDIAPQYPTYKKGIKTGDNIPNNFGMGFPWRMMSEFYGSLDPKINFFDPSSVAGPYAIWWNDAALSPSVPGSYNHSNQPTLADDDVKLKSVELVRYAKNPYMLRYVEHYKSSDDNAATALQNSDEDAWFTLISRTQMNYDVRVVANYMYVVERDGTIQNPTYDLKAYHNGERNIFLLKNIKEIPVTGVSYDIATVPTTHFEYDSTMNVDGLQTYSLSGGSSSVTLDPEDLTNAMMLLSNKILLSKIITPLGGETIIEYDMTKSYMTPITWSRNRMSNFEVPVLNIALPLNNIAVQANIVVASKTVNDRSGTTKRWDYQFGTLETVNHTLPILGNYSYDIQLDYSKGFNEATVLQPQLSTTNRPYTKYYHHTVDPSFWHQHAGYSLLWGKLYKVEYYDGDDNLLSKNETTYEANKAFRSRYLRNTGTTGYDFDYKDYIYGHTGLFNDALVGDIGGFWGGQYSYETKEYNDINTRKPASLDSYFIKVTQEKSTTYDKSCSNCEGLGHGTPSPESTLPTISCDDYIETITEYEYFDANQRGVTASTGFDKLIRDAYSDFGLTNYNTLTASETQLMYEPSWQLYKKKTYSPQFPDAYTEEEHFYIYDLINDIQYIPSFDQLDDNFDLLYKVYQKGLRNLEMERRITTKAPGQSPKTTTDYYVYEAGWENTTGSWAGYTTIGMTEQTLYANNHPCPNPPSTTVPPLCILSQYPNLDQQHGSTLCLSQTVPEGYIYCPCTAPTASTTGMVTTDDIMENRIWLRSTHTSTVSTYPTNPLSYDVSNDFEPIFDVDVIKTYQVNSRTPMGWVYEEENEKGLVTRYDYVPSTMITFYYCDNYTERTKIIYGSENFGHISKITVGLGTTEPLITNYTYNSNGTIATVTDQNGIVLSYDYDEYNRMSKAYRNGDLLAESNYSKWDNDNSLSTPTTFEQRTMQNYVETIQYNDLTGSNFAATRAFVDPLGRNTISAGHIASAPNDLVVSAYTVFDSWNRPIHHYKPFTLTTTSGFNSLDYNTPQSNTSSSSPKTTQVYEDNPRSRVLKTAKHGIDITSSHIIETNFCILDGQELKTELSLSNAIMSDWIQDAYSSVGRVTNKFLKSTITDEDGKQILEYANAIGQKIATLRNDGTNDLLTLFYYDSQGQLIKVTNPKNQSSYYFYNDIGQLYKKQTVDGGTTRYIYNKSGQITYEQDAEGAADGYYRKWEFDIMGRNTRQSRVLYSNNPFASFSKINSLDWENPILQASSVDEEIDEKRWYYGNNFNKTHNSILPQAKTYLQYSLTGHLGLPTHTISYNLEGNPVEYKFYSYNTEGQLKWEINQFNQNGIAAAQPGLMVRIDYPEYSLQGQLKTQNIDLDGNSTFDFQYHYVYDQWSRMKEIYISYDDQKANGYKVASFNYDDALGLVTELNYYDSESASCKNQPIDQITYSYDIRDRLTQIQSTLFDWSMYYDANNMSGTPTQQNWNGNINATRANYKLSGAGVTITNSGSISNFTDAYTDYIYTYDGVNRLVAADAAIHNLPYTNGSVGDVSYSYDQIGNLLSLTRTDLTETLNYNYQYQSLTNKMINLLVSKQIGTTMTIAGNHTYNYDNNGNLTYDAKRDVNVSAYGRANLPWQLSTTTENIDYLYDVNDLRIYKRNAPKGKGGTSNVEWYLRAGSKEIAVYDVNSGKLTWYVHGSERLAKLKHQLSGDRRAIIGGAFADVNNDYESVDEGRKEELGRTVKTDSEGEKYLELPNKLLSVTYADGTSGYLLESRTGEITDSYTIDSELDLVEPSQQLLMTTTEGEVITIGLDELLGVLDELSAGGHLSGYDPFFVPMTLPTAPPTPDLVFYIYDHLGNTRVTYSTAVSCSASVSYTVEAVVDYYPYGKILREYHNSEREKYLTTQHERDAETGLDYRGARFYDADLGRFLSLDPLAADFPDWSDYNYVLGNPLRYIDRDGRSPDDIILKGKNGSSVTIKTDLIDTEVDASSYIGDLEGNYELEGDEYVELALDIVGTVDPSPITDGIAAVYYYNKGDGWNSAISGLGVIPGLGDVAKLSRANKHKKTLTKLIDCLTCFSGSTLVLTEHGAKEIQDVEIGELVWAYNEETGDIALKEVTMTHNLIRDSLYHVYLSSGEIIEATPNHPFFVHGTWFQVRDLQTGDTLKTYSSLDDWIVVDSLVLQLGQFTVYNFTVADYHTYYVGQGEVLVHNCGGKKNTAKKAFRDKEPPSPALKDNPYSPREVNKRQSERRREAGVSPDPNVPLPDRGAGKNIKKGVHTSEGKNRHSTGERNVASKEEHSRNAKGNRPVKGGRGPR